MAEHCEGECKVKCDDCHCTPECKTCGECCRFVIVPVANKPTAENIDYYRTRGLLLAAGHYIWLKIDIRCPYLSPSSRCLLHGEHPELCRKFHCGGDLYRKLEGQIMLADPQTY